MQPQVALVDPTGYHNQNLQDSIDRLLKTKSYKDLSTVILCPTRGQIPAKVVASWMGLIRPMNQKVLGPIYPFSMAIGMEVGEAYNSLIEMVLNHPELSTYKYILTIEEDNMPNADALIRLYESIDDYDVVGGLYWTKGEGGQPMIYGDPQAIPLNFIPQVPRPDEVQRCNGLGMGFNLWKLDMFKDPKLPKPWFKTCADVVAGGGARVYTQDLYFFENANKLGYKFACDNRVRVGHYDYANDKVW